MSFASRSRLNMGLEFFKFLCSSLGTSIYYDSKYEVNGRSKLEALVIISKLHLIMWIIRKKLFKSKFLTKKLQLKASLELY